MQFADPAVWPLACPDVQGFSKWLRCHLVAPKVISMGEDARRFYDQFGDKLVADYVNDNPRTASAIRYVLNWLPATARRVLDVGCGIGWSTWEIKRHLRDAEVLGVDLSPRLIELAEQLFDAPGLGFAARDVTRDEIGQAARWDAVVMLDVYEHIPRQSRTQLHTALDDALSPHGVVILAFPSVSHQSFLRPHHPEGLQPVDEDVTRGDIDALALDIGADVVDFQYVDIWNPGDYVHVTLARRSAASGEIGRLGIGVSLEGREERDRRVRRRLRKRITEEGFVLADHPGPALCIVSPGKDAYSETFIRAHFERLPAEVHVLYGGRFPTRGDDGEPLVPRHNLLQRMSFRLQRQLRGLPWGYDAKRKVAVERFLHEHRIHAVLAEYGPTGVAIKDICQQTGIPLIVHFHGYDAYKHSVLEEEGRRYAELFEAAAAVVAVSRAMEEQLVELGAPAEKVFYNPCGVDLSLFEASDAGQNPPTLVAVGRFVDKKAPYLTLLAFKELLEEVQQGRLVMIGDGPLLECCQRLAATLGISSAVEFPGVSSHADLANAMRAARGFVQHSVQAFSGDSEGTPVAVLEAGASGLPVVATRHAGIPDVVVEGETGFLVDEGDVHAMAEGMVRLASMPDLAGRMGAAARKRIEEHFSMEKSIANLWRIITSAMEPQA